MGKGWQAERPRSSSGTDLPVFQPDHVVGAFQDSLPVGDRQDGDAPQAGEAVPQPAFGLDVERRREVVQHEQLGGPDERPRGGGALHLAALEPDAARADAGVEPGLHRAHVLFEDGEAQRAGQVDLGLGQAE